MKFPEVITRLPKADHLFRNFNASLKWDSILIGCVLVLVACSFGAKTQVTARTSKTEAFLYDYNTLIEQNGFASYLPFVQTNPKSKTCSQSSFGTMLIHSDSDDWITPADVVIDAREQFGLKGLVATGAPSDYVRDNWFGNLSGWTRSFIRGTYEQLIPIHSTATTFGMQDMYECISYGPESAHQAGEEALNPGIWVPEAEAVAEAAGKCLIYGPAVLDYERMATPNGEDQPDEALLSELISTISPHVDVWMIQLAKYQRWTDAGKDDSGNEFSMKDFIDWISWWVDQIKSSNPGADVWTQLGIGIYDPQQKTCLPPQPPEYILEYRAGLIEAGVDGIFVMPSQPCQESTNPQDHEYYLQSLLTYQQAIELACGQ
jgi:hypothetical protein